MKNTSLILAFLVTALVFGGGGFYGGIKYQQPQLQTQRAQAAGRFGQFAQGGANGTARPGTFARAQNGGATNGEIVSKDDSSLTLKLRDGGSKNIFYSSSTTIGKMTDGSPDDLAEGINVNIVGTTNQDGSITADSIQIRPAFEMPVPESPAP